MVDNLNPTNQFHPYQPPEATPMSERPQSGLMNKVRDYVRSNPAKALGALAVAAIGLGMLRRR